MWGDVHQHPFRSAPHSSSPDMPSSSSRPTSPGPSIVKAFRFSSSHHDPHTGARNSAADGSGVGVGRVRTSSIQIQAKGKERDDSIHSRSTDNEADGYYDPSPSSPRRTSRQSLFSLSAAAASDFTRSFSRRRRHHASTSTSSTSVSSTAPSKPKAQPLVLSEVIEITRSGSGAVDEEAEERERLRDAAAMSIGLDKELLQYGGNNAYYGRASFDTDATEDEGDSIRLDEQTPRAVERHQTGASTLTHASSLSISSSHAASHRSASPFPGASVGHRRNRAGSLSLTPSRTQTQQTHPPSPTLPTFPATLSSLAPYVQLAGTFPKHHPPASLLKHALAKQWKHRYVVFTSCVLGPSSPRAHQTQFAPNRSNHNSAHPARSYLHVFRASGEEREIERLEINEGSVACLAEEAESAGRRCVVKVGGADVSSGATTTTKKKGGGEPDAAPQKVWLLQIVDPAEGQRWIATIKSAVLGQRSVLKGLGYPSSALSGGSEPRGDMDVMLSLRGQGQGLIPSHSHSPSPISPEFTTPPSSFAADAGTLSSTHSGRSTTPKNGNGNGNAAGMAVAALKGLFAGGRPRSPSRATSVSSVHSGEDEEEAGAESPVSSGREESFGSMGSSLLSMLRSNGGQMNVGVNVFAGREDWSMASAPGRVPQLLPISTPSPPGSRMAATPILSHQDRCLERKIVQRPEVGTGEQEEGRRGVGGGGRREGAGGGGGGASLHPPPRRRPWTLQHPVGGTSPPKQETTPLYSYPNGNASASFGVGGGSTSDRPPLSPSGNSFGSRAPSLRSVSTYGSGENALDRSTSTNTNTNRRRWSRQSVLPKRLTPPAGPPPAVPVPGSPASVSEGSRKTAARNSFSLQLPHPYANNNNDDRSSSSLQSSSPHSVVSVMPTFAKRTSTGSVQSGSSGVSAQQHHQSKANAFSSGLSTNRGKPVHRLSLPPPPRPPPSSSLPPTPGEEKSPPPKQSFRESLTHRALRLSLLPPKEPPSMSLPPRPDELDGTSHRRSSSSGSNTPQRSLYPIPGSPIPPGPPIPAALGELPPTPTGSSSVSRFPSIKQRLRILSAPSPLPAIPPTVISNVSDTPSRPCTPASPIGERITTQQNDPNFLLMVSPVTPTMHVPPPPSSPSHPSPSEESSPPEITSLSPPPRRGSRQVATPERERAKEEAALSLPEDAITSSGAENVSSSASKCREDGLALAEGATGEHRLTFFEDPSSVDGEDGDLHTPEHADLQVGGEDPLTPLSDHLSASPRPASGRLSLYDQEDKSDTLSQAESPLANSPRSRRGSTVSLGDLSL